MAYDWDAIMRAGATREAQRIIAGEVDGAPALGTQALQRAAGSQGGELLAMPGSGTAVPVVIVANWADALVLAPIEARAFLTGEYTANVAAGDRLELVFRCSAPGGAFLESLFLKGIVGQGAATWFAEYAGTDQATLLPALNVGQIDVASTWSIGSSSAGDTTSSFLDNNPRLEGIRWFVPSGVALRLRSNPLTGFANAGVRVECFWRELPQA